MATIIPFLVATIFTLSLNVALFPSYAWQISLTVLFYILCVMAVNGLIAAIVCKTFPSKWFDSKFYTPSKAECKFYVKLGIKRWKDYILDLGSLNGFKKAKLTNPNSPEYLEKFILENNKGFLTHFLSIFIPIFPLFAMPIGLWLSILLPIALTNIILNFMPMASLRYNIPRLQAALRFATRKQKED